MFPYVYARIEDLLNALPPGLRGVALEMANRLTLPVDLIIINMISALSSVFQGLYDFENLSGRARPISENVIIVGPKASGKSEADRAIFDGLRDLDKKIAEARDDVKEDREFEDKLWIDEEKVLRSKYRKSLKDGWPTKADVEMLTRHLKKGRKRLLPFNFSMKS